MELIRALKSGNLFAKCWSRRGADASRSRHVVQFRRELAQSDWRQVFRDKRARPPTALAWVGEAVAIPISADKIWWRVGEWVVREQTQNSAFAFEKSLDEREEP